MYILQTLLPYLPGPLPHPPILFSSLNEASTEDSTSCSLTFSSSWYFIILCTGLINRSVSCNLCPRRCFKSCGFKRKKASLGLLFITGQHFSSQKTLSGRLNATLSVIVIRKKGPLCTLTLQFLRVSKYYTFTFLSCL